MEALWDFVDKLKLTTTQALLLLGGASLAIVCLCILAILKRKNIGNKAVQQKEEAATDENESAPAEWSESCGQKSVNRVVLMGSTQWCRASKWEEKNAGRERQRETPIVSLEKQSHEIGWQGHNSMSAVWQRPILRGEKCELPRFSGLILYDEKGRQLPDSEKETSNQEKTTVTVGNTVRDLL